jgi:hypothetical protein
MGDKHATGQKVPFPETGFFSPPTNQTAGEKAKRTGPESRADAIGGSCVWRLVAADLFKSPAWPKQSQSR